jgi:hypothetical protein
MSHNLTQPEEIDLVLKELDKFEVKADTQVTDEQPSIKVNPKRWGKGYVSPFRAAYMKNCGFDS